MCIYIYNYCTCGGSCHAPRGKPPRRWRSPIAIQAACAGPGPATSSGYAQQLQLYRFLSGGPRWICPNPGGGRGVNGPCSNVESSWEITHAPNFKIGKFGLSKA